MYGLKNNKNNLLLLSKGLLVNFATITLMILFLQVMHGQSHVNKGLKFSGTAQTLVLDAGHGGKDSGCLGSHSKEKDVALKITKQIGNILKQEFPQLKIIYTRDDDTFIPLHQRSKIANDAKANLFVSIHCNAVKNKKIHGSETYVMGLHRAEENLEVAKRENQSIYLEHDFKQHYDGYDPDSPIGHIMLSTYQNIHLEQSVQLASLVESELIHTCKHSRGVKQAGFVVLREATMPSILIETGFLTNKGDEALLTSKKGQAKIAKHISKAVRKMLQGISNQDTVKEIFAQEDPLDPNDSDLIETKKPAPVRDNSFFKLQIAAFVSDLSEKDKTAFEVYPHLEIIRENNLSKVRVGKFASLEKAISYQKSMRERGLKDAFVVKVEALQ